jgi:hypothetical protein
MRKSTKQYLTQKQIGLTIKLGIPLGVMMNQGFLIRGFKYDLRLNKKKKGDNGNNY